MDLVCIDMEDGDRVLDVRQVCADANPGFELELINPGGIVGVDVDG